MAEPIVAAAAQEKPVRAVTAGVISEELQHATIMIQCANAAGIPSSGTGFFFNFFKRDDQEVVTVVTNKHVISGAENGVLKFTMMKPDGRADIGNAHNLLFEKNFAKSWLLHPDPGVDLAILPLGPHFPAMQSAGKTPYIIACNESNVPTDEGFKELLPLEDILVVG